MGYGFVVLKMGLIYGWVLVSFGLLFIRQFLPSVAVTVLTLYLSASFAFAFALVVPQTIVGGIKTGSRSIEEAQGLLW